MANNGPKNGPSTAGNKSSNKLAKSPDDAASEGSMPDSRQMGKQMAALFIALAAAYTIFWAFSAGDGGAWIIAVPLTLFAAFVCFKVFYRRKSTR